MSSEQYKYAILDELDKLNRRIDLKIVRGRTYRKEALRHRLIVSQLHYIERRTQQPV